MYFGDTSLGQMSIVSKLNQNKYCLLSISIVYGVELWNCPLDTCLHMCSSVMAYKRHCFVLTYIQLILKMLSKS